LSRPIIAALLLGSARCNQLRQNQIARLAEVLDPWSALAQTASRQQRMHGLFAISPQSWMPARATATCFVNEQQPGLLGFDPQPLVNAIEAHLLRQDTSTPLPVPAGLSLGYPAAFACDLGPGRRTQFSTYRRSTAA
jgi:hypothetical protein